MVKQVPACILFENSIRINTTGNPGLATENGGDGDGCNGTGGSNGNGGGDGTGTTISYPSSAPTAGASGVAGGSAGKSIQGVSNVTESGSGTKTGGTA